MKAKEYLMQIRKYEKIIESELSQIKILRERAESITVGLNPDKVQSPTANDTIGDCVVKIIMLENELKASIEESNRVIRKCLNVIKMTKPEHQQVLYKRYFENETWETIAYEMHYTYQWVCVLHGRALIEVQQILDRN